MTRAKGQVEIA